MPLVERALQVLERRGVQPQLGLLKSTMLQLDSAFNERAYGGSSFSDFVEKLKRDDLVNVSGTGGRYIIERKGSSQPERATLKPEDLLPALRDVLENHRLEIENGCPVEDLARWFKEEQPNLDTTAYGFQQFTEFLNYAQDKTVVRLEPHEEQGVMMVYLGAEFYPPAEPPQPEPQAAAEVEEEEDEPQPYVEGQPTIFEPNPPPAKPKRALRSASACRRKPHGRRWRRRSAVRVAARRPLTNEHRAIFFPEGAPSPRGHYSPAVRAGDFVYVSGQGPIDPVTDKLAAGDVEFQTRLTLSNIQRILEAAGATITDVVKCSVFLRDAAEFARMNQVYTNSSARRTRRGPRSRRSFFQADAGGNRLRAQIRRIEVIVLHCSGLFAQEQAANSTSREALLQAPGDALPGKKSTAHNYISLDLIEWADVIFVMEKVHRKRLNETFKAALRDKKIVVLGISDKYGYMDAQLIKILTAKLERYLPV